MIRVRLLSHTADPERTVASAMRLCYSRVGVEQILEAMSEEEAARMVRKALKMGHLSVLEHASFTFAVEGISRACSHQLVRHRMASYSQQSQRWVKMHDFEVIAPPKIEQSEDRKQRFDQAVQSLRDLYAELVADGVPREDARYLMPNAAETKIVMSANARSLLNFFELRLDRTAQWEIRELAERMLEAVREVAPTIFGQVGKKRPGEALE